MILVTGATGFVGKKLMDCMENVVAAPSLREVSIDDLKRILDRNEIDTIIHTAAVSDIPTCATNPELSYRVNVILPVNLAKAAEGRKLVCFSSDQVYSGLEEKGPYTEDIVKPGNLYAEQKIEMENRVLDIDPNGVMLRAEWMYDYIAPKPNFYLNMIHANGEVSIGFQQYRGVTYLQEVVENMKQVCNLPGGAYNFGSETNRSMQELTGEFLAFLGKDLPLKDLGERHNLWMDCSKAKAGGVVFSDTLEGLKRCAMDHKKCIGK